MKLRGKVTQLMHPNYGWCRCCQTSWAVVEGFSVPYHNCTEEARHSEAIKYNLPLRREDDYCCAGLFAICTECWDRLTPEERLPYYEDLYWSNYWQYNSTDKPRRQAELEWEEIETRIRTNNMNRRFSDGLAS